MPTILRSVAAASILGILVSSQGSDRNCLAIAHGWCDDEKVIDLNDALTTDANETLPPVFCVRSGDRHTDLLISDVIRTYTPVEQTRDQYFIEAWHSILDGIKIEFDFLCFNSTSSVMTATTHSLSVVRFADAYEHQSSSNIGNIMSLTMQIQTRYHTALTCLFRLKRSIDYLFSIDSEERFLSIQTDSVR